MKLTKILTIKAELHCVSGLHIGAGDDEMHIGGIDNTVMRDPFTNLPYIPGSSLKGKIRSLLEWRTGVVRSEPLAWKDYQESKNEDVLRILQMFGTGGNDSEADSRVLGPTRISFWDCKLDDKWVEKARNRNILLTEVKSENRTDRISGATAIGSLRNTERVIAGAIFNFRLSVKIFENEEKALLKLILDGMRLLEKDSLGGSGSRGYGKVEFKNIVVDKDCKLKDLENVDPFA